MSDAPHPSAPGTARGLAAQVPAGPLPPDVEWRRWGLGEVAIGLVLAQVLAAAAAVVAFVAGDYETTDDFPLWVTGLVTLPLQGGLLATALLAARALGGGAVQDFFARTTVRDVFVGFATGVGAQLVLVPLVTYPIIWLFGLDVDDISQNAVELTERATTPIGAIILVFAVAGVAPVVEEIFFRGLVFGSYRKRSNLPGLARLVPNAEEPPSPRWNTRWAIVWSGVIFGAYHLQPLLFVPLSVVGMLFAWLYERSGRLGLAVFTHMGFNATTLFFLLVLD